MIIDCNVNDGSVINITINNVSCDVASGLEVYRSLEEFCDSTYGDTLYEMEDRTSLDCSAYAGPNGEEVFIMGGSRSDTGFPGQFSFAVSIPS